MGRERKGVGGGQCDTWGGEGGRGWEVGYKRHEEEREEGRRKGYGGTDMTAAIEHADKGNTDAIVVVTDGETGWPQKKTRARLIIALVQNPGHFCSPPSWARTIECYKEVNTYEH